MAITRPKFAAARIEAVRNEFHSLNEHEIEPGLTVHDLRTRGECNRVITLLNGDMDRIRNQIAEARLAAAKGKRQLDGQWLIRAQSAIRWKKNLVRAVRGRMEGMPLPPKPKLEVLIERRAIILDVIQTDIGDDAMKRYVTIAKQQRPDLFHKPDPVDTVDSGEKL